MSKNGWLELPWAGHKGYTVVCVHRDTWGEVCMSLGGLQTDAPQLGALQYLRMISCILGGLRADTLVISIP